MGKKRRVEDANQQQLELPEPTPEEKNKFEVIIDAMMNEDQADTYMCGTDATGLTKWFIRRSN